MSGAVPGGIFWRRARFWGGVAGVSILANFGLEVAAARFPQVGLAKLTAFTHRGAS
jgi:hypothetical protein